MTHIEQANEEAKKGGYVHGFMYDRLAAIDPLGAMEILWLDPQWWQALGKARGWGYVNEGFGVQEWRNYWHRFIDNLAEGKDAESFFKDL